MATKTNCSVIERETPVCRFHKGQADSKKLEEGNLEVSRTKQNSLESDRRYAVCSLAKSEETFKYYRNMNNFELVDMVDSANTIKGKIDADVKADAELGKKIAETSKVLNDLHVKLHEANNAACSMRNCLQSLLGFNDNCIPVELTCVLDSAKGLSDDGKSAANAMVNIAGIHTFSNIETLQPFATGLIEKLVVLNKLTDSLAANAKKDGESTQADLVKILTQLNKAEFDSFHITGRIAAHASTLEFICEKPCESICRVDEICGELGKKEESMVAGKPVTPWSQVDID